MIAARKTVGMPMRQVGLAIALASAVLCGPAAAAWCPDGAADQRAQTTRRDHILLLSAEDDGYRQIIGNRIAPNLNRLAKAYGSATNFFGEVLPIDPETTSRLGVATVRIHDNYV